MLRSLDSTLFDSIAGLPLHPLVVHFAVVLLPLAALGLVLLVAVPRWADRFGWLTLGVLAVGTGAAFVAKQSGEALAAQVGEPESHAAWGDLLPWLATGLLVLAGAWYLLHRAARRSNRGRSAGSTVVGLLAAAMALVVTGVTIVVGHSGAAAAWGDVSAAATSTVSASPAPEATTSTSPTPSASGKTSVPTPSPSATKASAYTMAQVAAHASANSCWTAIDGKVYNLTDWISRHPGGQRAILGLCGKDGTSAFNAQHGGQGRPAAELKQFLLGTLG
jgi:uncharacterized membrane protein